MPERATDEDAELLAELGADTAPAETGGRSAREQRILAGFEDIERFVAEHGRVPEHGESRDIFERLYAVRLDRMRELAECREVLKGADSRGLLTAHQQSTSKPVGDEPSDEELLATLGAQPAPRTTSPNWSMSVRATKSRPRRKSLSEARARTFQSSARCSRKFSTICKRGNVGR